MSNYRPISLVSTLYKILSKVLSIRLHKVMEGGVSSTQRAFIRGTQITEGILIANECMGFRRKSRVTKVVCKLDLEKA